MWTIIAFSTTLLGWALLALAAIGIVYTVMTAFVFQAFFKNPQSPIARGDDVTLLKPLHGEEPRLSANLATFLAQDHAGAIQMICGVQRPDDSAIPAVRALKGSHADAVIDLVIDPTVHGSNGKISNLINMVPRIAHPLVILSDSDIAVTPDYLARILAALDSLDVGAVTCLYRGRGDAGFWSRLGAAGLSWQFLPGAVFGVATGLAKPCMGSTIAMRRAVLDRIGGFTRFADTLADDYAIGEAIRALGLKVVVPPMLVVHASDETSLAALWRHELRWSATVRQLVPASFVGSVIGMPFPLALLAALFVPAHLAGAALALAALAVRVLLALTVDARSGARTASLWLLPLRDSLSLLIFLATFFTRSVDWRGQQLRMAPSGQVTASTEISA